METKTSLEFKLNQLDARAVSVPQTFTAQVTCTGGLDATTGTVHIVLPTSNPGAGILWNNAGTVTVGV